MIQRKITRYSYFLALVTGIALFNPSLKANHEILNGFTFESNFGTGLMFRESAKDLTNISTLIQPFDEISAYAAKEDLIPRLKEIFAAEGVPAEWIWLAEVESNFNSEAVSSKGAKGIFQFMPETADRFGLEMQSVDERLDPEKSAVAAAKYLKSLHEEFGNWKLALAAYNAGEGCVRRLLMKHQTKRFEDISFDLPSQTRLYVEKVLRVVKLREETIAPESNIPFTLKAWLSRLRNVLPA
jgi:hypothetical protein